MTMNPYGQHPPRRRSSLNMLSPEEIEMELPRDSIRNTFEMGRVKKRQEALGGGGGKEEKKLEFALGDDEDFAIPRESWRGYYEKGRVKKQQDMLGKSLGNLDFDHDDEDDEEEDDDEFASGGRKNSFMPQNLMMQTMTKSSPNLGFTHNDDDSIAPPPPALVPTESMGGSDAQGRVKARQEAMFGGQQRSDESAPSVPQPRSESVPLPPPPDLSFSESMGGNDTLGRVKARQQAVWGSTGEKTQTLERVKRPQQQPELGQAAQGLWASGGDSCPLPPQLQHSESMGGPNTQGRVKARQQAVLGQAQPSKTIARPKLHYTDSMGDAQGRVKARQEQLAEQKALLPATTKARDSLCEKDQDGRVKERQELVLGKSLSSFSGSSDEEEEDVLHLSDELLRQRDKALGTSFEKPRAEQEEFVPGRLPVTSLNPTNGRPNPRGDEFIPGKLAPMNHAGLHTKKEEDNDEFVPGKLSPMNHANLKPNAATTSKTPIDLGKAAAAGPEQTQPGRPGKLSKDRGQLAGNHNSSNKDVDDFVPGRLGHYNAGTNNNNYQDEEEDDFVPGRLPLSRGLSNNPEAPEEDEFVPGKLPLAAHSRSSGSASEDDDFVPGRLGHYNVGTHHDNGEEGELPDKLALEKLQPFGEEYVPGHPHHKTTKKNHNQQSVPSNDDDDDEETPESRNSMTLDSLSDSPTTRNMDDTKEGSLVSAEGSSARASILLNSSLHSIGEEEDSSSSSDEDEMEESKKEREAQEAEAKRQRAIEARLKQADEDRIHNAACCIQAFFQYVVELKYWRAQKEDVLNRQQEELAEIQKQLQMEKDQTEVELQKEEDKSLSFENDWAFSKSSFAWVNDHELMKEIQAEKEIQRKLGEWIRVCTNWNQQLAVDESHLKRRVQNKKSQVKVLKKIQSVEEKFKATKGQKLRIGACIRDITHLIESRKGGDDVLKKIKKTWKNHQRAMERETKAVRFGDSMRSSRSNRSKNSLQSSTNSRKSVMQGSFAGIFEMENSMADFNQSTKRRGRKKKNAQDRMHESFLMDLIEMES